MIDLVEIVILHHISYLGEHSNVYFVILPFVELVCSLIDTFIEKVERVSSGVFVLIM